MCASKFVVNQLCLGNRELGWELWNGKEVVEMTGKQIRQALGKGEQIYGLVWAQYTKLCHQTIAFPQKL